MNLDPVTLETFWRRFDATVDELAATLKRTSFSTVVRDVNDYATAIFDARARFDVVAISLGRGKPEIEVVKNAFELAY